MRRELGKMSDYRGTFTGTFVRYGKYSSRWVASKSTILLKDVKKDGKWMCDHLWLNVTKSIQAAGVLVDGDVLQFDARVTPYLKGYAREWQELDWKLSRPTHVRIIRSSSKRSYPVHIDQAG